MTSSSAESNSRLQRLRDAGYKLTNARLTVLQAIEESNGHLTSAQILAAVAERDPSIGRASVFRTLDTLTRLAILRPTYVDSSLTPTYVLLPDGHHHHILCVECDRVIEFENCGLHELTRRLEEQYHLEITGHLLEFFAVCPACVQREDSSHPITASADTAD
jgi:Fur family transcriptional regulator, ferric uptake regulator